MTNTVNGWDPIYFANKALRILKKTLGVALTVNTVYHEERQAFGKGSVITVPRPALFVAQDAPNSAAQDAGGVPVTINLDQWKEVVFKLNDKERTAVGDNYITQHLDSAAYAIRDVIEGALTGLYTDIPWYYDLNATPGSVVADAVQPRKILAINKARLDPANLFYMVDPTLEANLVSNAAFGQWNGAGPTGEKTQINGMMGTRFGQQFYMTQNVKSHTPGTLSLTSVLLNGAVSKNGTAVTLDNNGGALTGTVKKGDVLTIAGNAQQYAATADATAAGNNITVSVTPELVQNYADNTAVTVRLDSHVANLVYQRDAFGIVNVLLPDKEVRQMGGALVFTQGDEETNLSVRVTLWYEPKESATYCKVDVLYGVKTFYPDLAVRAAA